MGRGALTTEDILWSRHSASDGKRVCRRPEYHARSKLIVEGVQGSRPNEESPVHPLDHPTDLCSITKMPPGSLLPSRIYNRGGPWPNLIQALVMYFPLPDSTYHTTRTGCLYFALSFSSGELEMYQSSFCSHLPGRSCEICSTSLSPRPDKHCTAQGLLVP